MLLLFSEGIICYNKKTPAMQKPVPAKQAGGSLLLMLQNVHIKFRNYTCSSSQCENKFLIRFAGSESERKQGIKQVAESYPWIMNTSSQLYFSPPLNFILFHPFLCCLTRTKIKDLESMCTKIPSSSHHELV